MKLRGLKLATFKHATIATLQTAVNDFTAGKAVTSGNSGTVAYAAAEVGERDVIDQFFALDGGTGYVAIWYKEG